MPANTPTAIIQNATLSQQVQAKCELANLCKTLMTKRISSPAIIVVGQVVQMSSMSQYIPLAALHGLNEPAFNKLAIA
jgi:uroporphyrin-III C-methyltransferase